MAFDHCPRSKISTYKTTLPHDLLEEIFKRLPVKTLIRFTSVSKSWKSLISSPLFAGVKLSFTAGETPCFVLECSYYKSKSAPSHTPPPQIDFIDVVDGVVCVSYEWNVNSATAATLWNPSTRRRSDIPWSPLTTLLTYWPDAHIVGFGFDSSKNDFKVLSVHRERTNHETNRYNYHYEVFSVRDGVWRNPKNLRSIIDLPILYNHVSCFVNGNIHWITTHQERMKRERLRSGACYNLVLFDCESEEFKTMDLPQGVRSVRSPFLEPVTDWDPLLNPQVWRTYDGLFSVLKYECGLVCEWWVMESYGVASSWSKRLWFGPPVDPSRLRFAFSETMFLMDVKAARGVAKRLHFCGSGWEVDLRD